MVYIEEWNKYQEAAVELCLNSSKVKKYFTFMTISSSKFSKENLFNIYTYYISSIKVTNNFTVLKYISDLKKFERLNRSLMFKMQNRKTSESTEINFLLKSIF